MKHFRLFLCGSALLGFAVAAEDAPPEHQKWMKDLGSQMGNLRKGVEVEQTAQAMEATMKDVAAWWKSRSSEVAGKTCADSQNGAAAVAKAAKAGDKEGISAGMKMVNAGCQGCHDAHREKVAENVYKIK